MNTTSPLLRRYADDKWGNHIGISICESSDNETIRLKLPFKQDNMNFGGRIHGGVIATLLVDAIKLLSENVCANDENMKWRLVDFQTNYLKGGRMEELSAAATVTKRTREFLFCKSEVLNSMQQVIATSEALVRIYSPDGLTAPTFHEQSKLTPQLADQDAVENAPNKEAINLFNQTMVGQYPGCKVHYLSFGYAEMFQDDIEDQYDFQGNIAAGQLLLFFDNVASCSAASLAKGFGITATLTIQSTFCEAARGENLIGISSTYYNEAGLSHNDVKIYGEQSKNLKMFGTMTYLTRPLNQNKS